MSKKRQIFWDEERSQPRSWALPLLWPASQIYRGLVYGRWMFSPASKGRARRLPVPVVSVGNIVVGGTGKTPVALWIAKHLVALGKRPAILSRGYGGRAGRGPLVVADGKAALAGAGQAGDEPAMLARRAEGILIVSGSDRHKSGMHAIEHLGADCIVLDDGFQHIGLHRDLNLLLLDSSRPFGNGRLLPAGTLREPRSAITRADIVIFTRWEQRSGGESDRQKVAEAVGREKCLTANHKYAGLAGLAGDVGPEEDISSEAGALLLSGIAGSSSFEKTVCCAGFSVLGHLSYPDHHRYSGIDLALVKKKVRELAAAVILTTEKDAVRLAEQPAHFDVPIYCVRIEASIEKGLGVLREALEDLFK